ncbi:uncharacterized protein LOC105192547 [Harpegnathos saltator]|uniref:uncharacterized protein LOC105192547 n=1 Tax=Harpegnathos saltator TaxID=610380 RepID=UPI000949167B|nr:uncharacterized protein LOC105192547 [Harpegnathos saltator]
MGCKLITLLLCFEVIVLCVAKADFIYQNKTLFMRTPRQNKSAAETFVILSPKQIQRMEATIKNFLTRLIGPSARPITLRLSDGDGLRKAISDICEIIRAEIMEFSRASGPVASIRQREKISWNSTISEDWFSEGLLQGSLLLCDLVRVGERIWFTINHCLDRNNATSQKNEEFLPRKTKNGFKFLSVVNDAFSFNEKLFKCLLPVTDGGKRASSFDLNRAFANLAKGPPENTMTTLKTGLERASTLYASSNDTSGKQLHALLCHLLAERANDYGDCVKEVQRVEVCVSSTGRGSTEADHTLPAKPWLTAIEDISSCKIYIDAERSASVRCNFDRKVPRMTMRRVKYIYESILDRRISRRSPLYHAANELGNVLSKSSWGRQLAYDVCQYLEIYREGREKLRAISRQAVKDKKAAIRYKKVYDSLNLYKNGALKETMLAVGNFHRSTFEMEKFLIRGIENSFRGIFGWPNILLLGRLIDTIIQIVGFVRMMLNDTDAKLPISTNFPLINVIDSASTTTNDFYNRKMIHLVKISRQKYLININKETDTALEKLIQSMNHVSRIRGGNSKSTLACLANNLLLVAMFMETVSFISALFCLEKPKNELDSEESMEDWASPESNRR